MPPTLAEPPAAPAARPSADVATQAAKTTINVSQLPTSSEPSKPPKSGSARAKMYDEMRKKFGGETSDSNQLPAAEIASSAKPPEASPAKAATTQGKPDSGDSPKSSESTPAAAPTETPPAEDTGKGKKQSPWKLVDEYKSRAAKAETEVVELRKQIPTEEQRKSLQAQLGELQGKVKEMTEDLRFYRAEKYDPDLLKAKEEYNRAFTRAMGELKDVAVTDPATQQPRALTINDLAELAFMPLGQAQQVAKEIFGDLAPYVMDHRNEIRRLWDAHQSKLEELKKTGAERDQQRLSQMQKTYQELSEFIQKTYQQANDEFVAHPKYGQYFKQREGDEEWNERLAKGFKFVDDAMSANARDPRLTPEQRAEIVKKHAAIRNRAAAFSVLRNQIERLEKQLADAHNELKQYKETAPPSGGRTSEPPKEKLKAKDAMWEALQKIAH